MLIFIHTPGVHSEITRKGLPELVKAQWLLLIAILVFLVTVSYSCRVDKPSKLDLALSWAGSNRGELESVLHHYRDDSLKLEAARYLITNMAGDFSLHSEWREEYDHLHHLVRGKTNPEIHAIRDSLFAEIGSARNQEFEVRYDLNVVSASYLIRNIDLAFEAWEQAPWYDPEKFDLFCKFVLPYRNIGEPVEYWRDTIYQLMHKIVDTLREKGNPVAVCRALNSHLMSFFKFTGEIPNYAEEHSIIDLLRSGRGDCTNMANLGAATMRTFGIPTSVDFTPLWSTHQEGHYWNAVIYGPDSFKTFMGTEANPAQYDVPKSDSKPSKVFRIVPSINEESFAEQAKRLGISVEDLPELIRKNQIEDVTSQYLITTDVQFHFDTVSDQFAYLATYNGSEWRIITGSIIDRKGNAHFRNMGADILYQPYFYRDGDMVKAGQPFVLHFDGRVEELKPRYDNLQSMRISRLYPLKKNWFKDHLYRELRGAQFTGANRLDFTDEVTLFALDDFQGEPLMKHGPNTRDKLTYEQLWEDKKLPGGQRYRYLRLKKSTTERFRIGEMEFYGEDPALPLQGTPMGNMPEPWKAFDGIPGYDVDDRSSRALKWVGIDLGEPCLVSRIRFIPYSPGARVHPDREYELFFWDGEWKPAGKKIATRHELVFENVPSGTFYRFHISGERGAKRVFVYKDGQQIWY